MQVHELVARFAAAVETADPMGAARKVLEDLRGEIDHIEKMLAYISGVGGNARQVFYRSPNLTMLKVCFPNGRRTPPHDHGTWATILLLSGEEKNTLYRRENGRLRRVGEVTLTRGEILRCRPKLCMSQSASAANPRSDYTCMAATSWGRCRDTCGIRKLSRNTRSTGIRTRPSRRPHRKRPRRHS